MLEKRRKKSSKELQTLRALREATTDKTMKRRWSSCQTFASFFFVFLTGTTFFALKAFFAAKLSPRSREAFKGKLCVQLIPFIFHRAHFTENL